MCSRSKRRAENAKILCHERNGKMLEIAPEKIKCFICNKPYADI